MQFVSVSPHPAPAAPTSPQGGEVNIWSGRPASNRLPQPWEGCALPGELRPLVRLQILGVHVFSTTPSDSGADSATTDRTNAAYPSTRARDCIASRVDAMMEHSARPAEQSPA